jgi:hypothetical protein
MNWYNSHVRDCSVRRINPTPLTLNVPTDRLPNEEALNAVRELIECGVNENKIQTSYQLIGHRQNAASSTECPGDELYEEIKNWPNWAQNPSKINAVQTNWDKTNMVHPSWIAANDGNNVL